MTFKIKDLTAKNFMGVGKTNILNTLSFRLYGQALT